MIEPSLIKEFEKIVGRESVFSEEADLAVYSYDAAVLDQVRPGLAVRPLTAEALGRVVGLCNKEGLPLTVRGAGTNLSGGTIPAKGGVVVLTNALSQIIEINEQDMYAVVQPGVITARFASAAAAKGLFYPPDPGSQKASTLGGNVAENAGGLRGLKYGVTRDYVMAVRFFDVEGREVISGSKTVKCVTGFNLGALMIGSEGALGVMSEITLKLIPPPAANKAMSVVFDSIEAASETVSAIIASRIIPATLELMDNFTVRAVEEYSKAGLPVDAAALLLIEVDGHPAQVEDEARAVEDLCRKMGAVDIKIARDAAERDNVWEARRAALSALARMKPTLILEDATVPRSRIPDMVRAVNKISERFNLTIGTFGHAGDGNLHPTILFDRRNKDEWDKVEEAINEIFDQALALGGTLSGEHGIGLAKKNFLEKEIGRPAIEFSQKVKRAIDPKGILNPGKIIGAL